METIKIAHLYYDLMNLYGESGNVKSLIKHLENHNVKVISHFLTVDDEIDFKKYDIFYIGSGNRENFGIVREDIIKYQSSIKEALKNKKFFFVTGNGLDLFGSSYHDLTENTYPTLNLLKYESFETDFRIVGESTFQKDGLDNSIIGFQNRFSVLKNVEESNLFEVIEGTGYTPKNSLEGIKHKNFYGTYLLGPVLIRNPYFTEYFVEQILKEKNIHYELFQEEFETKAYEEYQKNIAEKNEN